MADTVHKQQRGPTTTFQHSQQPAGPFRTANSTELDSSFTDSQRSGLLNGSRANLGGVITALEPELGARPENKSDYKGRIRTWPGILLFLGIVGAAAALITLAAVNSHEKAEERAVLFEENIRGIRRIKDGRNDSNDIISEDGQVGNPKKYADMGCELPNYLSKNGQIWAQSSNGTEVPVGIKGVNWFGMETGIYIPLGLWENQENGTSAYEIAAFLARNKFNSVRFPLSITSILKDTPPLPGLINMNANRALNITTYMSTVKSIIDTLAYRQISVMISLHTIHPKESVGAWFSEKWGISEDDYLDAVDKLTSQLCNDRYWNILGLDLKNEPHECTWGGGGKFDWLKGSKLIAERMLKGCPKWLAFVEGVNGEHKITLKDGRSNTYFDWWGGGLEGVKTKPLKLSVPNKIVWAPHYYNTCVSPAWYLYGGGTPGKDGVLEDYIELDDESLKDNVRDTMDAMFGFLAKKREEAVVMGEFAGLYAKDKHPKKTTKRTTDKTIEVMLEDEYAGAYMWSLNPESAYQFNPADKKGHFTEGLLLDDWLSPDKEYMAGMEPLDRIRDLKMFPCFPKKKKN